MKDREKQEQQLKLGNKRPIQNEDHRQDDAWKVWFNRGRAAFAESRYQDAKDLFSKALQLNAKHLTLLDCRAATLEKLDNYTAALQDGAAMINLEPTMSKGYLRSGKLLTLQKKFHAAVKVYDRGIKHVDRSDARYSLLRQMRTAAEAHIMNKSHIRSKDPVLVLSRDMMDLIFRHLSFERRVQCLAVSKSWRDYAKSWPGMWRDLDFGLKRVSNYTLKQYLTHAQGRDVRKISFCGDKSKTKNMLQSLINNDCCYLESLIFHDSEIPESVFLRMLRLVGTRLKTMLLDSCFFVDIQASCPLNFVFETLLTTYGTQIMNFGIRDMAQEMSQPLLLDWRNLPQTPLNNITTLSLLCPLRREELEYILKRCRKLRRLELGTGSWRLPIDAQLFQTYCIDLQSICFIPVGEVWENKDQACIRYGSEPGLQEFVAEKVYALWETEFLGMVGGHLNTLRELNINFCSCVQDGIFTLLATQGAPQLQILCIASCGYSTENDLLSIIAGSPLLREINVSCLSAVTNKAVQSMCRLANLEFVNISNCPNVTGVSIRELVDTQKDLKKLEMNNCPNISVDAALYATEKLGRKVVESRYK